MQILIFFLLGLLVNPSEALKYAIPAILVMIAMTLIIRPFVVYLLIGPLKSSRGQKLLVSWAGLRGAASVVFAILVVVANREIGMIVFNIAFIVVLLSIAIQGSLLPFFSRKFDMIDEEGDVLKTFNDYSDTEDVDFITAEIDETHKWVGKQVKNLEFMPCVLLVLIIRNGQNIIPNGRPGRHPAPSPRRRPQQRGHHPRPIHRQPRAGRRQRPRLSAPNGLHPRRRRLGQRIPGRRRQRLRRSLCRCPPPHCAGLLRLCAAADPHLRLPNR